MTEILDKFGIQEFFAEALARVDRTGPNRRLIFTISQPTNAGSSLVAVVKIVVPDEVLAGIIQKLAADLHTPKALASLLPSSLAN